MGLKSFFAENIKPVEHERVQISDRIIDEETGEPEFWEVRAVSAGELDAIQKRATKLQRVGKTDRYEKVTDEDEVGLLTLAACVVYPDLRNLDLQNSFGAKSPEEVLNNMLTIGERQKLIRVCNRLNSMNEQDIDSAIEQSKN